MISYNIQQLELESIDPAPLAAVHVVAESQDDLYHSKIKEALPYETPPTSCITDTV